MASHDPACSLDLIWKDERPGCGRCNIFAPQPTPTEAVPPLPPPPDTKRSELICSWPPSISFAPGMIDLTESSFVQEHIDSWILGEDTPDDSEQSQRQPAVESPDDPRFHIIHAAASQIYDRLPDSDAIRHLRLHGSDSSDSPIHCSLEIARLTDPCLAVFEAVSYTWANLNGDAKLRDRIYVGPEYVPLAITTNCASALRRFRIRKDRVLWIDAICINQTDVNHALFIQAVLDVERALRGHLVQRTWPSSRHDAQHIFFRCKGSSLPRRRRSGSSRRYRQDNCRKILQSRYGRRQPSYSTTWAI